MYPFALSFTVGVPLLKLSIKKRGTLVIKGKLGNLRILTLAS